MRRRAALRCKRDARVSDEEYPSYACAMDTAKPTHRCWVILLLRQPARLLKHAGWLRLLGLAALTALLRETMGTECAIAL